MKKRDWLLREAEREDAKELAEAEKMETGGGSDSLCTYYHKHAQHLRYLAATAWDDEQVDEQGRRIN